MLILLLTLAWQSFVIQTHVHPLAARPGAPTARASLHAGSAAANDPGNAPSTCPICRQLALAGHLLSPSPITLDTPAAEALPASASTLDLWSRRDRSHAWLGRGPPQRSTTRRA